MKNTPGPIWFTGSNQVSCNLDHVKNSVEDLGEHYLGIISLMPGLSNVELAEQGKDFVTIRTNEGLMKRTEIKKIIESDTITFEFYEEYQAGKTVTTNSHFIEKFANANSAVTYNLTIRNTKAPGFMGFLYRTFGSSNTGKAFLESCKTYLEAKQ